MTIYTFILRDAPADGTLASQALNDLRPASIVYSVDFGVRLDYSKLNGEGSDEYKDKRHKLLQEKLNLTKQNSPFNGATQISPLIPLIPTVVLEKQLDDVVGEALRIFPVDLVYIDLGVNPDWSVAARIEEALWKVDPNIKIGAIAPLSSFLDPSVLIGENVIPCPFLSVDTSLKDQMSVIVKSIGNHAHVFCSSMLEADRAAFVATMAEFDVEKFVFWSCGSATSIDLTVLNAKKEATAQVLPVEMEALYSSIVRKGPSLTSEMVGHVLIGQKVNVRALPAVDEKTQYGKVYLDEIEGYVAIRYDGHLKFKETNNDTK